MTRRTPLALALVAATSGLALGAQAAPVTSTRLATTAVRLDLAHGRWLEVAVDVTAGALRLETRACDVQACDAPEAWSGPVAGSQVDASQARATLRTTLHGVPLTVTWTPSSSQGVVLQSLEASSGGYDETASTFHGDPADVRVAVGGQVCRGTGSVGDEVRVSDSAADGAAPLAELRLPTGVLSC